MNSTAAGHEPSPITLEQIALLQRRKEKLQAATQELESLLAGRSTTLAQLGAQTAAGQEALAQKLTRAYAQNEGIDRLLEQGRFSRFQQQPLAEAQLPAAPECALAAPFFYCAVRLAAGTPWYGGTAEEVAQLAASAQARAAKPRALLLDELCDATDYLAEGVPRPDDFFAMADDLYRLLTGAPIADAIPAHLREMVAGPYQQALDEAAWAGFPLMSPQQLDEAVAAGQLDAEIVQRNRAAMEAQWNQLVEEAQTRPQWETDAMEAAQQEEQRRHRRIAERGVAGRLCRWGGVLPPVPTAAGRAVRRGRLPRGLRRPGIPGRGNPAGPGGLQPTGPQIHHRRGHLPSGQGEGPPDGRGLP